MTEPSAAGRRTGRRPGSPDTRDRILTSARELFARDGMDKTSMRAIAAAAGVDPALIHHYFGSKRELFLAAIELPVDPQAVISALAAAPVDELGAVLIRNLLQLWDSEARDALLAIFRSNVAAGDTAVIRSFILDVMLKDIAPRVDSPQGSGQTRITLVASQVSGLLLTRYLMKFEPLASMAADEVVVAVAPTVQRYLTGRID
ncbi:TetR/AcrR family transcriptional regulator [Jongsikchunia kroppenstedtii]|uniref:TetR/AcrR family transcriptional regulator n=1 Tax=Jongsikchunia kroppenstedtii TaxID=1121721 RepID=UPI000370B40E|nr:TetR family transcriptional regulator [Jongsikchunia kroppenstedtii]